jgi:hypothetical protein
MFEALLEKLSRPRHEFMANLSPFHTPDASHIAAALDVKRKAAQEGARNYPSSDSRQQSSTELEIHERFREIVREGEQVASDQWNAYTARMRSASFQEADVSEALAEGRRSLERARESLRTTRSELVSLNADRAEAEIEFAEFRKRNGLVHRMPRYPADRKLHIAVLVLLVVVESIINGLFFAKGSELGIVGGVIAAVVLSSLNLGLGFLSGLLAWRGACGRGIKRIAGILGSGLWVVLAIKLNHFIACYRDLFALNSGVVSLPDVLSRMSLGLSGLVDAESLVLLTLGLALNLLAAFDGFRFDDRFPEYGATDRRRREAVERHESSLREHAEAAAAAKDRAFDAIKSALQLIKERSDDRARAEQGRKELAQAYLRHQECVQLALETVMRSYWEANERERSQPPPERATAPTSRLHWRGLPQEETDPVSTVKAVQDLKEGLERLLESWPELRLEQNTIDPSASTGSTLEFNA